MSPDRKCQRATGERDGKGNAALCRRPRSEHADSLCPNGSGRTFYTSPRVRAGQSYNIGEATLFFEIMETIERGGSTYAFSRSKSFEGLLHKSKTVYETARAIDTVRRGRGK